MKRRRTEEVLRADYSIFLAQTPETFVPPPILLPDLDLAKVDDEGRLEVDPRVGDLVQEGAVLEVHPDVALLDGVHRVREEGDDEGDHDDDDAGDDELEEEEEEESVLCN